MQILPIARLGKSVSENRALGGDEPLIRPDWHLRFFPPIDIPRNSIANDLTNRLVILPRDQLKGGPSRGGKVYKAFHPDVVSDQA